MKIQMKNLLALIKKTPYVIPLFALLLAVPASAGMLTVEQQGPKYKYTSKPSEKAFIEKTRSKDRLVSNVTAGVVQGVDSNPLLDSTHKADNYTQESVDMHFKYPLFGSGQNATNSKFGFNITNVNYYRITDVNTFDAVVDASVERKVFGKFTVSGGYLFETLWFPHDRNGSFVKNELNASVKHAITRKIYQKFTNRLQFRNYLHSKVMDGNGIYSSDLRYDVRELLEHELGAYPGKNTKVKVVNQVYFNYSNYQYLDYYDFLNYKVGLGVTHFFTKKLSAVSGIYYQRRNYDSRTCSDKQKHQKDNLYLLSASLMYEISKSASAFINYSHSENHSNEPLERYVDTIYTAGLYYAF